MAFEPWPWPAPKDDGAADHLVKGYAVPSVELTATDDTAIDLSNLEGRSVVFVYPYTGRADLPDPPGWDDIPGAHGSTPQAEGFRDHAEAFDNLGVKIFGVSGQDSAHQKEFSRRAGLPFVLLSDEGEKFQTPLRLPTFEAGPMRYLKRVTLVIDEGRIVRTFYPVHPPDANAQQVLEWLNK